MKTPPRLLRTSLLSAALLMSTSTLAISADLSVVASIKPVHSLVASVMQGVAEPTLLLEGASSPHTATLKPSQATSLEKADVIFWIGHDLEAFLEKPIETVGARARSVELGEVEGVVELPPREGGAFEAHDHGEHDHGEEGNAHDHGDGHDHKHEAAHDHSHEHGHGEVDPHVWLDPENAKAMARAISATLSQADPDNADAYAANLARLEGRLDTEKAEIANIVAPIRDKGYVVFHDAYQYFEKRFDLHAAGSITVSPEVMPGADRVKQIRAKISDLGATCVFAEPQFEPKLVSVVIEGTKARSGVLDPLGADIPAGPDQYPELLKALATSLADCLSAND
jgi:zinc transport system substrate-binding protein